MPPVMHLKASSISSHFINKNHIVVDIDLWYLSYTYFFPDLFFKSNKLSRH